jgi:hypothetical protein
MVVLAFAVAQNLIRMRGFGQGREIPAVKALGSRGLRPPMDKDIIKDKQFPATKIIKVRKMIDPKTEHST